MKFFILTMFQDGPSIFHLRTIFEPSVLLLSCLPLPFPPLTYRSSLLTLGNAQKRFRHCSHLIAALSSPLLRYTNNIAPRDMPKESTQGRLNKHFHRFCIFIPKVQAGSELLASPYLRFSLLLACSMEQLRSNLGAAQEQPGSSLGAAWEQLRVWVEYCLSYLGSQSSGILQMQQLECSSSISSLYMSQISSKSSSFL